MKKTLLLAASFVFIFLIGLVFTNYPSDNIPQGSDNNVSISEKKANYPKQERNKKTLEEKALFDIARVEFEFNMLKNPSTGVIPLEDKLQERAISKEIMERGSSSRAVTTTYVSRGPSNLGGRTRSLVVDITDNTGNTMLAGGISGGVFRTTDGGASWTKVSSNGEIHNVTCIVQDPRSGFQNIWYYGTGETSGNSTSADGAFYLGRGVWQSIDSGLTWTQVPGTDSSQEGFDNLFDIITNLAVSPTNGDVFAANLGRVSRFNGAVWSTEIVITNGFNTSHVTDVVASSSGRIFAALSGNSDVGTAGVWTSPTGDGSWTRIATTATPAGWAATGRTVLGVAPSNPDVVYAMYTNGNGGAIEADLWKWDQSTTTWTNYSSKLPDETGGDLAGNDPFAVQGGYDLVVNVKPDDEDFVVIGGTNAYKIEDIVNDPEFLRIGGYANNASYNLYSAGGDTHHPDIHALVFNPFNTTQLFSGTDGGVHRTDDINAASVSWTNLNNNYQTYQYYHVAIDQQNGSDGIIGGAQDNGTTVGGTIFGQPNTTDMNFYFGGDGVAAAISRDNACTPFFFGAQEGLLIRDCPAFVGIAPTGSSSQFVTYFHLDPDNNNALYYAGNDTVYMTTASSAVTSGTWTNLGTTTDLGVAGQLFVRYATTRGAYSTATSYLLMGTNAGGVFRLNDPQNATDLSTAVNITPPGATGFCSALAIHPTNPDIVMATYSNYGVSSIFVTADATAATPTWVLAEQNLALFSIRSAMITEASGEINYYVGTARGLYSSPDPTTTNWTIEAPAQIGFAVARSMDYRPSDNKLLIGTHGNGMYMGTVNSTLSIDSFEGKGNLTLYPNPATTEIGFNFSNDSFSDIGYSIFDLTGKKISSGLLDGENKIDVESLNAGIYIVELKSDNNTSTGKFIKK